MMQKFRNTLFYALVLFVISSATSAYATDSATRQTQSYTDSAEALCSFSDRYGHVDYEDANESRGVPSLKERFMALFVAHFGKETISEKEYLSLQCRESGHNYQTRTLLWTYSVYDDHMFLPPFNAAGRHITNRLKIRVEQDFCCIGNYKTHRNGWYDATTFFGSTHPPTITQLLRARHFRNACPNLVLYGYEFCGIPGYAIEDDFLDIRAAVLN